MPNITEAEYNQLRTKVENAKSEAERAKGSLEASMRRLKEEFGCDTLKEAEQKLLRIQNEMEDLQEGFNSAFTRYQAKWNT